MKQKIEQLVALKAEFNKSQKSEKIEYMSLATLYSEEEMEMLREIQ